MEKKKEMSKSGVFPVIPFKKKKRKSVQLTIEQLSQVADNYSFKTKLKNVEGNKFKKIPKNNKLTNLSLIQVNNELKSNKDKNDNLTLLNSAKPNKEEENVSIEKKFKAMNVKSNNEQKGKKRNKIRVNTIKEKSDMINFLKKSTKIKRRRKASFNREEKGSDNGDSKKKKKKQYNSSQSITEIKNKEERELDNIRHILNVEEKVKKVNIRKEENKENEEKNIKSNNSNLNNDNDVKKKENNNIKDNNQGNKETNNNNKLNINKNKQESVDKKEKNNKKEKKKEVTNINNNININYIETKNNYEVKPEEKNENNKNKTRKKFCFCCLTKEDNSSDFD